MKSVEFQRVFLVSSRIKHTRVAMVSVPQIVAIRPRQGIGQWGVHIIQGQRDDEVVVSTHEYIQYSMSYSYA